MKNGFIKPFRLLLLSFLERETSFLGRQQLYVLVYYTAAIVVGISATLLGVSGTKRRNASIHAGDVLKYSIRHTSSI